MTDIRHETISIYTETLFALARDAWVQGKPEAFFFVKGYLVGLVPSNALDAFLADLDATPRPPPQRDAPNGNGGALVTNPVPPPELPPAPQRRRFDEPLQIRESATLQW